MQYQKYQYEVSKCNINLKYNMKYQYEVSPCQHDVPFQCKVSSYHYRWTPNYKYGSQITNMDPELRILSIANSKCYSTIPINLVSQPRVRHHPYTPAGPPGPERLRRLRRQMFHLSACAAAVRKPGYRRLEHAAATSSPQAHVMVVNPTKW